MAAATLNDVIKVLKQNDYNNGLSDTQILTVQESMKDELGKLTKMLGSFFLKEKANAGDKLEEEREKREKKDKSQRSAAKATASGSKFDLSDILSLGGLASMLPKMLLPLTGGLAALSLAFAGFRGWELEALKQIKNIKLVPTQITTALKTLKARFLGVFGLLPDGTMVVDKNDPLQGSKNVGSVRSQIASKIADLKTSALKLFGLDEFGNVAKNAKGVADKPIIGRVTFQINRLIKPLKDIVEGVSEFATGRGAKLFGFIRNFIGGGVKVVGATIGKILWPIGFLFALFDGVEAYRKSDEEGFIAKLGDGIGGFVGDLIGAPFDMLKGAVRWLFNKAFGLEVDPETGKVTNEEAGMAKLISDSIGEFSFEKFFGGLTKVPFKILQGIVDFFTADSDERADIIKGGVDQIKVWGQDFAGWIYSFMPSLDGLKNYFRTVLKDKLPTKLYEFLYGSESETVTPVSDSELRAIMAKVDARNEATAAQAEATKNLNSGLSQFDTDGDGFLKQKEYTDALRNPKTAQAIRALLAQYADTSGMGHKGITGSIKSRQGLDLSLPGATGGGAGLSAVDARNQSSNNTSNFTNVQTRLDTQDVGLSDGS